MKRLSLLLAVLLGLCAISLGQDSAKFQEHFDRGIAALMGGKHDEGIEAFKVCLEIDPKNSTCAYNIACGYSLKDEVDSGFQWLEKAVEWGFGNTEANIQLAETKDTDLTNLRGDARFAPLMEKMKQRFAKVQEIVEKEWKNPIVILPEGAQEMETVGALVVLHDYGETKQSVAEGPWKSIAAEHGLALVVPSGKVLAGTSLEDGMSWYANFEEFSRRYWVAEESIKPALEALAKLKQVDPARTILVGQGQSAMVAFNQAMRAPKKYAGVLTIDGPILANLTASYIPAAVSAGVRVRAVLSTKEMWGIPPEQIGTFTSQMRTGLRQTQLQSEVATYTPDEEKPGLRLELVKTQLAALLPQAAAKGEPVEAGSGTDKGSDG